MGNLHNDRKTNFGVTSTNLKKQQQHNTVFNEKKCSVRKYMGLYVLIYTLI